MPQASQISRLTKGRRSLYYDSIILSIFISIVIKYYWAGEQPLPSTLLSSERSIPPGNWKPQGAIKVSGECENYWVSAI